MAYMGTIVHMSVKEGPDDYENVGTFGVFESEEKACEWVYRVQTKSNSEGEGRFLKFHIEPLSDPRSLLEAELA